MVNVADFSVAGAIIISVISFSCWLFLFRKKLPGLVRTLKTYFAERQKALMKWFTDTLGKVVKDLKDWFTKESKKQYETYMKELDGKIEHLEGVLKGHFDAVSAKVDNALDTVPTDRWSFVDDLKDEKNTKAQEFLEMLRGEMFQGGTESLQALMNEITDPQNKDSEKNIQVFFSRASYQIWHGVMNDETMRLSVTQWMNKKMDLAIEMLIKKIAEDPELITKIMAAYQQGKGGGGGDMMDPENIMRSIFPQGLFGNTQLVQK